MTRNRGPLIAAIVLPVLMLIAIMIAAAILNRTADHTPLSVGPVPAPQATSTACTTLLASLPADLADYHSADIAAPVPAGTRAWQRQDDGDPAVLRCGVDRPLEFNRASPLQVVNGVQWFEIAESARSTWFAVDRGIYLALTIPHGSGPTPLQTVSDAITHTLPAHTLDPAPLPN